MDELSSIPFLISSRLPLTSLLSHFLLFFSLFRRCFPLSLRFPSRTTPISSLSMSHFTIIPLLVPHIHNFHTCLLLSIFCCPCAPLPPSLPTSIPLLRPFLTSSPSFFLLQPSLPPPAEPFTLHTASPNTRINKSPLSTGPSNARM